MLLAGMNSWIQPSINGTPSQRPPKRPARHPGALRAGIAIALVALTLLGGFGRPADTAAFKAESMTCTTVEAGFQYTFSNALAAKGAGDTRGFTYWNNIAQSLQGLWYDLGCGGGSSGGGWHAT